MASQNLNCQQASGDPKRMTAISIHTSGYPPLGGLKHFLAWAALTKLIKAEGTSLVRAHVAIIGNNSHANRSLPARHCR